MNLSPKSVASVLLVTAVIGYSLTMDSENGNSSAHDSARIAGESVASSFSDSVGPQKTEGGYTQVTQGDWQEVEPPSPDGW